MPFSSGSRRTTSRPARRHRASRQATGWPQSCRPPRPQRRPEAGDRGEASTMVDTADLARTDFDALIRDRVDAMVTARVDEIMTLRDAERAAKPKKMAIIATKGTLDWAYPPLILATTAK